jgi:hypothetical protein
MSAEPETRLDAALNELLVALTDQVLTAPPASAAEAAFWHGRLMRIETLLVLARLRVRDLLHATAPEWP